MEESDTSDASSFLSANASSGDWAFACATYIRHRPADPAWWKAHKELQFV